MRRSSRSLCQSQCASRVSLSKAESVFPRLADTPEAKWGMGQHLSTIDVREMQLTTIWFWASLWLYYSALGFIKLSILTQYLRVFVQDTFRRACFVMIGLVVVSSCWAIFSGIFMCNPVYLFWTAPSLYGDPKCFNRLRIW